MLKWKTQKWPVERLKEWANNPRVITDKGLRDLEQSIKTLGYIDPIAINTDGTILGGHARKSVLQKLKIKEVDVRVPDRKLTTREVEQAIIRLNKNIAGEWDLEKLESFFDEADLLEWGFEKDQLLLENSYPGKTDPDEAPPLPKKPKAKPGDIWLMGDHRIMCGDSTRAADVARLIGGDRPHLMVTDPPYGVEYDPAWRSAAGVNKNKKKMGKVANDDECDWSAAWALFQGDVAYVWHADRHASEVQRSLEAYGFGVRSQIIWAKDRFALSRGHYHWQHEPCWYVVREGKTAHWGGDHSQCTLWNIKSRDDSGLGHGTQKPVECMHRPIENNSKVGDAIYEPFAGSGTTIIAAEMTGRKCLAMEISPEYVDVAVSRWQNFTGKEAIHEKTRKKFGGGVSIPKTRPVDAKRVAAG